MRAAQDSRHTRHTVAGVITDLERFIDRCDRGKPINRAAHEAAAPGVAMIRGLLNDRRIRRVRGRLRQMSDEECAAADSALAEFFRERGEHLAGVLGRAAARLG